MNRIYRMGWRELTKVSKVSHKKFRDGRLLSRLRGSQDPYKLGQNGASREWGKYDKMSHRLWRRHREIKHLWIYGVQEHSNGERRDNQTSSWVGVLWALRAMGEPQVAGSHIKWPPNPVFSIKC